MDSLSCLCDVCGFFPCSLVCIHGITYHFLMSIHGGKLLVRALADHGVKRAYCVAGESYLPVLDGFLDYPDIDVVTCRQEGGVTFMAEAYGQLTGEPGVALVTRGPGACNASIGLHSAMQASTPMVLLVGLHSMADRDKEAFQEFDLPQMFLPILSSIHQ